MLGWLDGHPIRIASRWNGAFHFLLGNAFKHASLQFQVIDEPCTTERGGPQND
jgi:hypothetical protein